MAKEKKSETSAVAKLDGYLMEIDRAEDLVDTVRENVGGDLSAADFERIRVPSGGGQFWEIDTLDGPVPTKAIEGVLIYARDARAYWEHGMDEGVGGSPPDCSSDDGETGIGSPGGTCSVCPMNKFGSKIAADGKPSNGKACKQTRDLFILRKGEVLPSLIQAPPGSLKNVRTFFVRLAVRNRPYTSVVLSLALEQATQKGGGNKYSRIVPTVLAQLEGEEFARVKAYAAAMRPILAARKADVYRDEEE